MVESKILNNALGGLPHSGRSLLSQSIHQNQEGGGSRGRGGNTGKRGRVISAGGTGRDEERRDWGSGIGSVDVTEE